MPDREEIQRQVDEVERRLHSVRSALPESRARVLYGRIVSVLREHGSEIDLETVMEERRARLDEVARAGEHRE